MMTGRGARLAMAVGTVFMLRAADACAADFPVKPIRFVVPFAPGGGGDIVCRQVAQHLTERLGESVVVDNRGGAGGNVGTDIVAKSPADGYTLLMANVAPMAINASLYRKLPYDPARDFAPVTLLASFPNVLVVHPAVAAKNLGELIALAKAKPGLLTYASAGSGSTTHLAAELLRTQAAIDLIHVPYKGGGAALIDLLAGHVTLYFGSMPAALPYVRAGRLRALAVTSLARSAAEPDIPSVAEAGFPGFEAVTWIGLVAPAGTPAGVVARLNAEVVRIMQLPVMRERMAGLGAEPLTNTPAEFAGYIRSEIVKWARVVKESGITPE